MAYTDQKRNVSPASIGAAIMVNGGVVAALLLMGVTAVRAPPDVTKWITIMQPPPPRAADPKPRDQKPTKPASNKLTIPPRPDSPAPSADNDIVLASGDFPDIIFPSGTGVEILPEKPIIALPPPPVIKVAKRNPRYADDFQPEYPPGMIREGREGVVTVRVLIGVDGRVRQVEAISADQGAFLEATRKQALRRWRFIPATKDGGAFESWQQVTVRFEMPF